MTIQVQDRPLDQLRQEVIDQLVLNYGHERISKDAFERRLDEAWEAKDHDTLTDLTTDLETFEDPEYDNRRDHMLYADESETEDRETIFSILSGAHRGGETIVPGRIRILNILGGCHLDYSLARFSEPETRIKVLCLFGGIHIHVPEGVKVRVRAIPILSGTHNNSQPDMDPKSPVIILDGVGIFSGIHIGVKRTLRERFQDFADNIKEMLS